jgi:hypothetical protein
MVGQVACKEHNKCIQRFGGKPKRDHLEDVGVEGRIILNQIIKKQDMRMWVEFIWLSIETRSGLL